MGYGIWDRIQGFLLGRVEGRLLYGFSTFYLIPSTSYLFPYHCSLIYQQLASSNERGILLLFPHYNETKVLYHVVHIIHLKDILSKGIQLNERNLHSEDKYSKFNQFMDQYRTTNVPPWVLRERAFFASLNFSKDIHWHSHSALLAIKIQEEKCWIANENLANEIYDPFVLSDITDFDRAKTYLEGRAKDLAKNYWENSYALMDFLTLDLKDIKHYDEEVMIFHDIPPQDIRCLMIITDHKKFTPASWQRHYRYLSS